VVLVPRKGGQVDVMLSLLHQFQTRLPRFDRVGQKANAVCVGPSRMADVHHKITGPLGSGRLFSRPQAHDPEDRRRDQQ